MVAVRLDNYMFAIGLKNCLLRMGWSNLRKEALLCFEDHVSCFTVSKAVRCPSLS